jgi:type I restriction enzyme S subunit
MQMTEFKLGEIAEFINGGAWNQSAYSETGIPVVRVSDIHNHTADLNDCKYLHPDLFEQFSKHELIEGDLVICTVGSHPTQPNSVVGRPGIMPKTCHGALLNQNAVCIRPSTPRLDKEWLSFFARSQYVKDHIISHARGSASQVRVAIGALKDMTVLLPSLDKQKAVASTLKNYDNLIENNNRRIAILEEMAQSLYREWFVKFRFPGHEQCQMVDSPLGMIPEGWVSSSLGELVHFKRNSVKKGQLENPTPYMGLEHFPRKSFALSEWDVKTDIGSSKLAFEKGDILFGKIRPYFHKVGVAQTNGLCSSDTFVLSAIDAKYSNLIAMVTFSESFVAQAVQTSQGTKMPRANWDVLSEYYVALAPDVLLSRFNCIVGPAIEQVRVLGSKNRNLIKQRDLLLPKLISGQIDLSQAEQASA